VTAPARDWDAEVRAWVQMKAKDPSLTHQEFYRQRKLPKGHAQVRIGKLMTAAWKRITEAANKRTEARTVINLSDEMVLLFRTNQDLVRKGELASRQKKIKDFSGAVEAIRSGTRGQVDIMKLLAGGEPLMPPAPVETVFRWNEPTEPKRAKSRKSKKKKKRRRK